MAEEEDGDRRTLSCQLIVLRYPMRLDVRWAEEPAQINNRKLLKLKNLQTLPGVGWFLFWSFLPTAPSKQHLYSMSFVEM